MLALIAQFRLGGRRAQSLAVTIGLLSCSALLVHISDGMSESYFHFFVMVAALSLYEDWVPFGAAVVFVLFQQGITAAIVDYDDADSPWVWALVHSAFVGALSLVCLATWRASERDREAFRSLVDSLEEGVLMVDGRGTLIAANPSAERILGVDPARLMAPTGSDPEWTFVAYDGTPLAEDDRPLRLTAATGRPQIAVKLGLQRGDGSTRWLSVSTRAVEPERDPPYTVVLSFSDVTDERNALEALARSNAELGQFAYVASHDLSEPLRMVSSYLNLLRRRYHGRLDSDADEFIDYAVDGAARMRSLIEALLAYSRAGAGEKPARVELGSVTANVLRSLAAALVEAGAEIEIGELPAVMGDRAQLEQLLQNLVANALKFRADGRARVRCTPSRPTGRWCGSSSPTAASASPPTSATRSSRCSSACTTARPTRARASGWRSAARSSNATAGGSGSTNGGRRRGLPVHASRSLTAMSDVAMPRLSDSMEEGTILKWLKSDGDEISKGEELVEIETDKANMTYEADESGTLEIVASEGDTLPVGETIARIGEGGGGEKQSEEPEADEGEEEQEEQEAEEEPDEGDPKRTRATRTRATRTRATRRTSSPTRRSPSREEPEPEPDDDRIKASPIARRMAREQGIDLADIEGSGPGGRIVKADIEAASEGGEEQPAEEEPEAEAEEAPAEEPKEKEERKPAKDSGRGDVTHTELSRLQRTVARRMAESKATAPDFVMTLEVDMEAAVELRGQLKAAAGDEPAPSFNDFVVKAAALALRDFPRANGAYRDGQFELYSARQRRRRGRGPATRSWSRPSSTPRKSLGAIAAESRRLAERVREGKITPPELSSGTFTVSNLGMYGIRRFVAVISPAAGRDPCASASSRRAPPSVTARSSSAPLMELTLTCDHRILYGADAAEFLAKIREYLEAPLKLAL